MTRAKVRQPPSKRAKAVGSRSAPLDVRDLTLRQLEALTKADARRERIELMARVRPGFVETSSAKEVSAAQEMLAAHCELAVTLIHRVGTSVFNKPPRAPPRRNVFRGEHWNAAAPYAREPNYEAVFGERVSVVQSALELLADCYRYEKDLEDVARGEEAHVSTTFPAVLPELADKYSELEDVARELHEWMSARNSPTRDAVRMEHRIDEALTILRGCGSANPLIRLVFMVESVACARRMFGAEAFDALPSRDAWIAIAIHDHIAAFDLSAAQRVERPDLWRAVVAWDDRSPGKRRQGEAGKWVLLAALAKGCGFGSVTAASLKVSWARTRRATTELEDPLVTTKVYLHLLGPFEEPKR